MSEPATSTRVIGYVPTQGQDEGAQASQLTVLIRPCEMGEGDSPQSNRDARQRNATCLLCLMWLTIHSQQLPKEMKGGRRHLGGVDSST